MASQEFRIVLDHYRRLNLLSIATWPISAAEPRFDGSFDSEPCGNRGRTGTAER